MASPRRSGERKKWEVQAPKSSARSALLAFHESPPPPSKDAQDPPLLMQTEDDEAKVEQQQQQQQQHQQEPDTKLLSGSAMDNLAAFLPLPMQGDIEAIPEDAPASPKHASKHSPRRFTSTEAPRSRSPNSSNHKANHKNKKSGLLVRRGSSSSTVKTTPVRSRRNSEPAVKAVVDSSPSARIQTPSFSTTPNPRAKRSGSMQTISFSAKKGSKSRSNSRTGKNR